MLFNISQGDISFHPPRVTSIYSDLRSWKTFFTSRTWSWSIKEWSPASRLKWRGGKCKMKWLGQIFFCRITKFFKRQQGLPPVPRLESNKDLFCFRSSIMVFFSNTGTFLMLLAGSFGCDRCWLTSESSSTPSKERYVIKGEVWERYWEETKTDLFSRSSWSKDLSTGS